jgi:hypothetical protein
MMILVVVSIAGAILCGQIGLVDGFSSSPVTQRDITGVMSKNRLSSTAALLSLNSAARVDDAAAASLEQPQSERGPPRQQKQRRGTAAAATQSSSSPSSHHNNNNQQQQQKQKLPLKNIPTSSRGNNNNTKIKENKSSYYNHGNNFDADGTRAFNAQLTTCNDATSLLAAFVERTTTTTATTTTASSSSSASSSTSTSSAATHLAGAGKMNSVNFSTILHRLAKLVSFPTSPNNPSTSVTTTTTSSTTNTNAENELDNDNTERKRARTLSDPRFALLLCAMAEYVCSVNTNLSVKDGKQILYQYNLALRSIVSGSSHDDDGAVEEADNILNDIIGASGGSVVVNNNKNYSLQRRNNDGKQSSSSSLTPTTTTTTTTTTRRSLAKDTMTQLTSSSSSNNEPSSSSSSSFAFTSRESSNVCWALAKLRFTPPGGSSSDVALPVGHLHNDVLNSSNKDEDEEQDDDDDARSFVSRDEMSLDILQSSMLVRMKLYEEAINRSNNNSGGSSGSWIPELSRLSGRVFDLIAVRVIEDYETRRKQHQSTAGGANAQEMASILWAYAKVRRGNDKLFNTVGSELIRQTPTNLGIVHNGVAVKTTKGGSNNTVQGPKPQELSNTIWAFATAGVRSETQVNLVKYLADVLDVGDGQFFGHSFKPQERSNIAWALATLHSKRGSSSSSSSSSSTTTENDNDDNPILRATEDDGIVRNLRWVAKSLIENIVSYKPQEISNSVWAFATVGFGYDEACGTNSHNDYIHVTTDDPGRDKAIIFDALEVIAENAIKRLDRFKAQELNNLAWGFARLGHRSEKAERLFVGVAKELVQRTWQFKPQDIGTTLWSLATAGCYDYEAFNAGASRLNIRQIRTFKPQEMSNTVWAIATAGFAPKHTRAFDTTLVPTSQRPTHDMITTDPITECFAAVASETMRRPYDYKDQELKDVLWSFSKAGVRHPILFQKIARHLVGMGGRGLSTFSSQGLGNTLWSFAKQAQLSLEVIETLGDSVKLVSTGRLAVYETSCLDNGEDVVKRLFATAAEAGIRMGLNRFTNQDLSNTVWAYSTLGILHTGFFKQAENEVVSRLRRKGYKFRGQEIANIIWSFATLNAQPDLSMVDALSSYVVEQCRGSNGRIEEQSIVKLFGQRQELANVAWSCAVIGRYPKELMDIVYMGLLGTANDPKHMKQLFNDNGLEKSTIMTLYYVQVAAQVEAPELHLSLPMGFPNGWGEGDDDNNQLSGGGGSSENDYIELSSSMLTLTVSKLQKAVSGTFDKIGFNNILEHVIDASEISNGYENNGQHSPKQFLSIDIANVDKLIGIEVDGPGHFVRLVDGGSSSPSTTTTTRTSTTTITTMDDLKEQFADRGQNRVNGPTILKHRLLTHLGWDIIHLPYWEYQEFAGDSEREKKYCQSLLEKCNNWK